MNLWLSNILRFVICVLLQVLIINNLNLLGLCTPYVYILFLISLPARIPRWAELLIGAATGITIDIFCNSIGVNMAACLLVAYLRPLLIDNLVTEKERLTGTINSTEVGMSVYLRLIGILIILHHSAVVMLETFSFQNFHLTLINIVLSSAITFAMLSGYEILRR